MPRKSPIEIVKANLRRAEDDNRNMAQMLVAARAERDTARAAADDANSKLMLQDADIEQLSDLVFDLNIQVARLEGYIDCLREINGLPPSQKDEICQAVTDNA
jgi:hypothetical protein